MIDYRDRSLYSSTGYIKAKNFYLVVKAPYSIPKDDLFINYTEATEEEYKDYQFFIKVRAQTRRESISRNKENNND